jgi:hypothetical protein
MGRGAGGMHTTCAYGLALLSFDHRASKGQGTLSFHYLAKTSFTSFYKLLFILCAEPFNPPQKEGEYKLEYPKKAPLTCSSARLKNFSCFFIYHTIVQKLFNPTPLPSNPHHKSSTEVQTCANHVTSVSTAVFIFCCLDKNKVLFSNVNEARERSVIALSCAAQNFPSVIALSCSALCYA